MARCEYTPKITPDTCNTNIYLFRDIYHDVLDLDFFFLSFFLSFFLFLI